MASASSSLLGSFFGLSHQHTDLLAQRVALAQLARLGDGGALLLVQLQYLVHEGELDVLKLFLDVFPHKLGVSRINRISSMIFYLAIVIK